jgi:Ca2+-binding EF-hand superfamily protein
MLEGSLYSRSQLAVLWAKMFSGKRGQSCQADAAKAKATKQLLDSGKVPGIPGKAVGHKPEGADDSWIKKWGYGPAAYLLDFFDPLFQKKAVKAFKEVHEALKKLSNKDTKDFVDPFALDKLISKKNLKKIGYKGVTKNYNKAVYEISINTVQLNTAMPKWKWYIEPKEEDFAQNLVSKYDFDGDGRLNVRELIIADIDHNKNILGVEECKMCFQDIAITMDAIFSFMDCNNDGMLNAEELWAGLPQLNRKDKKYNIFKIKNSDNIRTNAINDFVLKNSGDNGSITKEQFRTGLLHGLWDRQTSTKGVINDDSRNLKSLRWDKTGSTDTVAFAYVKEKTLAALISKASKKKK